MGTGSDKKGQDKKQIREKDRENCKAGRQTLECKATLVWTRKKERRRLRGEKDDEGAWQKEKKKAKEKLDRFGESRHGKGWVTRSRSSEMENTVALWRPRVGRSRKKKKTHGGGSVMIWVAISWKSADSMSFLDSRINSRDN